MCINQYQIPNRLRLSNSSKVLRRNK